MGIFSDVIDGLFGGEDDSAQDATIEQNKLTREDALRAGALARSDALNLYPAGDRTRNDSYRLAAALLGQLIPQQQQTFQMGNLGAQQALLGGQSRFRNALLGMPDTGAPAAPMALSLPDPSTYRVEMPAYEPRPLINVPYNGPGADQMPQGNNQPGGNVPFINLAQFLGGRF